MTLSLIYDDRASVPGEIASLMGVERFSAVRYRKRTLRDHVQSLAQDAGLEGFVHLQDDGDLETLRRQRENGRQDDGFVYLPSNVIPRDSAAARVFLEKLRYAGRDLYVPLDGKRPALLRVGRGALDRLLQALLRGDALQWVLGQEESIAVVDNTLQLEDISKVGRFIEFLSSNFDARHFNDVKNEGAWVTKTSDDRAKLKREYDFHKLIEGPVESFFLRPFDFRDDGAQASYKLERLNVPDVSLQWIHDALSVDEFAELLERVFVFLDVRPTRRLPQADYAVMTDALFASKLEHRMAQLKAVPAFKRVDLLLREGTTTGSVDGLMARWKRLWRKHSGTSGAGMVAVSHGDLCFSNMLYDKRTRQLKLIDPRGASAVDDLYMHPYYDLAKLSHSILGGYDLINHGLFQLTVGSADLAVTLKLEEKKTIGHRAVFEKLLVQRGINWHFLRVCEASLFLSMLPLHSDIPGKVLAFAVRAAQIMDEVDEHA